MASRFSSPGGISIPKSLGSPGNVPPLPSKISALYYVFVYFLHHLGRLSENTSSKEGDFKLGEGADVGAGAPQR